MYKEFIKKDGWSSRAVCAMLVSVCAFVFFCLQFSMKADASNIAITYEVDNHYEAVRPLLEKVNALREENGLDPLTLDYGYTEVAMERAAELSLDFSHRRPNGTWCPGGENIAIAYTSVTACYNAWHASEGHNSNMLTKAWKYCGFGCVEHCGVLYWVTEFYTDPSGTNGSIPTGTVGATRTTTLSDANAASFKIRNGGSTIFYGTVSKTPFYIYNPNGGSLYSRCSPVQGTFTYSGYDESILSVDPVTGYITPKKVGSTNITVTIRGTSFSSVVPISVISQGGGTLSTGGQTLSFTFKLEKREYEYTGKEICPKVVEATDWYGNTLVEGKDYKVVYENNINPGTGRARIYGIGNYASEDNIPYNISFTIVKSQKAISSLSVSFAATGTTTGTFKYTGGQVKPAVVVKDGDKTLTEGKDYTVSYANCVDLNYNGAYVTVKGDQDDYVGSTRLYYSIARSGIDAVTGKYYKDEQQTTETPATETPATGTPSTEQPSTEQPSTETPATEKPAVVTPSTEQTATEKPTSAEKIDISSAKVYFPNGAQTYSVVYTGKSTISVLSNLKVVCNGKTLEKGVDYFIALATRLKGPGTAKIEIAGKNAYTGKLKTSYDIVKKDALVQVRLSKTRVTYNGKPQKPAVTVLYDGREISSKYYTVQYAANTNPGSAKIVVKGKGVYKDFINVKKTFIIVPKKMQVKSLSAGRGTLTAKWAAQKGVTGYIIQVSRDKSFKTGVKTKTTAKTTLKISSLSRNKKYYCRIRAYKTINGTKYYGAWSTIKAKSVK